MANKQSNKDVTIKSSYTELNKFGQAGQYDKALKSVNRILGLVPNDEKALHCKVICLIQLSRFAEAQQFIIKNNLSHLVFEKVYCDYRLNQPQKALESIETCGISPLPLNLSELKAQILYKLERYEDAYEAYKMIIKNTHDDYDQERKTNLSAVIANLPNKKEEDFSLLSEETYELCFNSACAYLNSRKFGEAEKKLRLCEKICRETLEEDGASQDEIEEELAVIRVQLAYCLQMQGQIKEATNIYTEFLKKKSKDTALVAVASNNSVVLNREQNVFDSKKKMRLALAEISEHKLNQKQKRAIAVNNCLLALFTNSLDHCKDSCDKLLKTYPDIEFEVSLIKCACFCKDKNYNEAVEILEKFKNDNKHSFAAKFAIVQLHLSNGNKKSAIDTLLSLGDDKFKPGVVSTLVTLYLALDNKAAASDILKSAVEWYKKRNVSGSGGDLSDMWRHAADFHLRGGGAETAASSLEELFKLNRNDMKVLAQLVIAYAQFDPKKAQEASKKLPALKTLTAATEIDALESANWMMATKAVKKTTTQTSSKTDQSPGTAGSDGQKTKVKSRRKRKGKLPKNYNPEVPPDPERWLPKYERSTFKKKRDRRNKDVIKGSQGTTSTAADQFDMSKNVAKSSPLTPHQEPTPAPRHHQHRKGAQKKNKKGRH